MEAKTINLSSILKGAPEKGVTVYSPWFGDMKIKSVEPDNIKCYLVDDPQHRAVIFDDEGFVKQVFVGYSDLVQRSAECMLFPSKDNREWSNFKIDMFPDLPNTWAEFSKKFGEEIKAEGGSIPYSDEMKSLQKLMILRDRYRKASKRSTMKYNIVEDFNHPGTFKTSPIVNGHIGIISFQDDTLGGKFIENFSDMLKDIKEFF